MSLDWYNTSKVGIRFNDEISSERKHHTLKKNNGADLRLGEFYSTEKVRGELYDLIMHVSFFTANNKYHLT